MSEGVGTSDTDRTECFEAQRARLAGLAYRITGSRSESEDIVQEAWLRWDRADHSTIDRPEAWLTTVTSRLALDRLRSAQHRREQYVGSWLPEVAVVDADPAERIELAESLTIGFLTVLERLTPVERVVFLLADVWRVPFDEIAGVVDRTPTACRQVASRARRRVVEGRPRFSPTDDDAWRVTFAFLEAATGGDLDALTAALAHDVVETSDGGARRKAGRRPVVGADRVARFVANLTRKLARPSVEIVPRLVNGQPGVVVFDDGRIDLTAAFSVVDGRIDRVWVVVAPDKLPGIELPAVR